MPPLLLRGAAIKVRWPVHVDLALREGFLTRMLQDGRCQVERTAVVEDAGVLRLQEIWIKLIAEAFVNQSRFDPLHTAETEQMLRDRLPGWLAQASAARSIEVQMEFLGVDHGAEIDFAGINNCRRAGVSESGQQFAGIISCRRNAGHSNSRIEQGACLGLQIRLRSRVGGEVFLLEPGATARGLLKRCTVDDSGAGTTLSRHMPWDQAAIDVQVDDNVSGVGQPTHLLYGHNALRLNGTPLVLGSQASDSERHIDFQESMPGVSRRHCVVSADNGQFVVTDHSRYGTFLNGHRIDGSAVLQTGDLIRIGTPGFEIAIDSRGRVGWHVSVAQVRSSACRFLDCMCCGFGAVILFFMIINSHSDLTTDQSMALQAETNRLEIEVLEGRKNLALARTSIQKLETEEREAEDQISVIEALIAELRAELAKYDNDTLAKIERVEKLQSDIKSLEEEVRRLLAAKKEQDALGEQIRSFKGDGDRQYLTGLKLGGDRTLILVDRSASMLHETIVNIIRRKKPSRVGSITVAKNGARLWPASIG